MSVILFPHSFIPESIIRQILAFFEALTIYQPWFMESPTLSNKIKGLSHIKILNPPADLKPKEEFSALLFEYRRWVEQNRDRSYTQILKNNQERQPTEDTTWEIRQMLGQMSKSLSGTEESDVLKWHLMLHLSMEIETQRMEADKILKSLKEKNSLLEGSIEKAEEIKSLFEDLPRFGPESLLEEYHIRQILEAWLGLFGGYLKENEPLITFDCHIMDYLTEQWDSLLEDESGNGLTIQFKIPDPAHLDQENGEMLKEMRDLIMGLGESEAKNESALDKLSSDFESGFTWKTSMRNYSMTINCFYPVSNEERLKKDKILKHLSGKTVILIEEEYGHE
ncbi:MAG: hypothetical protein JRC68_04410 [Deltaproteobacteria bacterium]|nr:hypothetical protein [Deltaproteobacteria bacterium]